MFDALAVRAIMVYNDVMAAPAPSPAPGPSMPPEPRGPSYDNMGPANDWWKGFMGTTMAIVQMFALAVLLVALFLWLKTRKGETVAEAREWMMRAGLAFGAATFFHYLVDGTLGIVSSVFLPKA